MTNTAGSSAESSASGKGSNPRTPRAPRERRNPGDPIAAGDAGRSPAPRRARSVLLIGSGPRPQELGAVLSALGAMQAQRNGDTAAEPERPMGLGDLEELLTRLPASGTLILDYGRVPGEDIGFVRRFLERHTAWRLVLVGEDVGDRRARGLLALPRTQWLPWPPDLDQINALIPQMEGTAPAATEQLRPARKARRARHTPPPNPDRRAADGGSVDVGNLLEELLVGASLEGEDTPRYLYRCDHALVIERNRDFLAGTFNALLHLARTCAGSEGVVSAQVDPLDDAGSDAVQVRIDFPEGELLPAEWPQLLDQPGEGEGVLSEALQGAAEAVRALRKMGALVFAREGETERLRIEVQLASEDLSDSKPAPARKAKPEDPFA